MKFAIALLLSMAAAQAAEVALKAGIARVEITPSTFMQMAGYANRKCGPANGTHDPLYAKVLVLSTGDVRLAIVTLDISNIAEETLQHEITSKLGISVVLLAVSHTHSGPAAFPFGSSPALEPPPYVAEFEQKIFAAVKQASESMFPARITTGRGAIQLGYNRLLMRDDGRARALFDNLERVPYGPVDPEFMLLRVEDMNGNPRALLVHYGVHAVVMGPSNCKYSADYPGVMQAKVEAEMPGVQCMFVQGGAGDVNPLFQARSGKEEEDFAVMNKMGNLLAGEVLKSAKAMKPVAAFTQPIQYTSEVLKFKDRWNKEKTMDVGITTVLIDRQIAIAAIPGEPMHKLQRTWKEQADVPFPLFYGYTYSSGGGWAGYIPDLRSAAYGGYGADATTTIEVGAGETIMQHHLINLYRMLGMWHDAPGRP